MNNVIIAPRVVFCTVMFEKCWQVSESTLECLLFARGPNIVFITWIYNPLNK